MYAHYLVALQAADANGSNVCVGICQAGFAEIDQQFRHRVPCNSGHARSGTNNVSLYESCHNADAIFVGQRIHNERYA
jgi:hypothetical protein